MKKLEIGKRLENVKRHFASFILASLCIAASAYMVMESSGYYQKLYGLVGLSTSMGIFTAILSEAFQLVLVIALPSSQESRGTRFLLLAIVFFVYVFTVFASGMNIAKPLIEQWSQSSQDAKLYGVLLEEQKSIQNELKTFRQQQQRLNTAISIQASRKSFQELKEHLNSENPISSNLIKVELVALWALRILIQLANLVCGRILARNFRRLDAASSIDLKNQNVNSTKASVVRKWKARYTRQDKGFIGIMEFSDGSFASISPDKKKRFKTFRGALDFFENTPYQEKLSEQPTWETSN